jgi:hypothetical protein
MGSSGSATGAGSGTVVATYGSNTATDTFSNVTWITGSNSNDTMNGGDGNDLFEGRGSNDFLFGGNNNDTLDGGAGSDSLNGGSGVDAASYADAGAGLTASLANPGINTGDAAGDSYFSIESLWGSNFNDTLLGDGGNNTLSGGGGNDVLDGGFGGDTLIGGGGTYAGADFASYASSNFAITASLGNPAGNTGDAAGDTYSAIGGLIGSNFNDSLTGDGNTNFLIGGAGTDSLDGGGGLDFASYLTAGAGLTASLANPGANTGDAAGDSYTPTIEGLAGSRFADTLVGDANNNVLIGEGGGDILNGVGGIDTASYMTAAAGVIADLSFGGFGGDAAGDQYTSIENLDGSGFADQLYGDSGNNTLTGNG